MSEKVFYDDGWDAAHKGEPIDYSATEDWKDGWLDYWDAEPQDRMPFHELVDHELGLVKGEDY